METEYVCECCIVEGIDFSLSLSVIFGLLFIDGLLIIQFSPHREIKVSVNNNNINTGSFSKALRVILSFSVQYVQMNKHKFTSSEIIQTIFFCQIKKSDLT